MRAISLLLLAVLSWSICAVDSTKEILLDNDKVQVVRLTYPAGTQSGMHTHLYPQRVVYVLHGGSLQLIPEDGGKVQKLDVASGTTLYLPAQTHNVHNIGDNTVVLLETEIKL